MSKAVVAAYAVQADGTLSTTAAAKTTSGTDGSYALPSFVTVTNVTQNGTPVATLDRSKHLITFPNGDFVSLEFGF